MEIRSNVAATRAAANALTTAALRADASGGSAFRVHAACSDAAAAGNHDESAAAFGGFSAALVKAMLRDADAVRAMAEAFQESDRRLARIMGGVS